MATSHSTEKKRRRVVAGHRYGRLIARFPTDEKRNRTRLWMCDCDCGESLPVRATHLLSGNTQSCGCYQIDRLRESCLKHGNALQRNRTREYAIWCRIQQSCYNPRAVGYQWYGKRGIKVCDRWRGKNGFANFLADMGRKPEKYSLDRIDMDGDYCPENCRWATAKVQANNTRHCRFITHDGERLTMRQWAERCGIAYDTLRYRLDAGWDFADAISIPVLKNTPASQQKYNARQAVHRAVVNGKLPPVHNCPCIYCGGPGQEYHHHRGYEKEHFLSVVPICKRCHSRARKEE